VKQSLSFSEPARLSRGVADGGTPSAPPVDVSRPLPLMSTAVSGSGAAGGANRARQSGGGGGQGAGQGQGGLKPLNVVLRELLKKFRRSTRTTRIDSADALDEGAPVWRLRCPLTGLCLLLLCLPFLSSALLSSLRCLPDAPPFEQEGSYAHLLGTGAANGRGVL
jgi:hypothetical protein